MSAKEPTRAPHLVFASWLADAYRRSGYVVSEVRDGVWQVEDPPPLPRPRP
jgi:hypothetical protein